MNVAELVNLPHVCAGVCTVCGEIQSSQWDCGCGRSGENPKYQVPSADDGLAETADLDLFMGVLSSYLSRLPSEQRQMVLSLFGLDGETRLMKEIADGWGITYPEAQWIKNKALRNLHDMYRSDGLRWEPGP